MFSLSEHSTQSLGDISAGATTALATVQGNVGGVVFSATQSIGIVRNSGTLIVKATLHTIGFGHHPFCSKEPIIGMTVKLYDKSPGSCAAEHGLGWWNFEDIYNDSNCEPVGESVTDAWGKVNFTFSPGKYLVIGYYAEDNIYVGRNLWEEIEAGDEKYKYLPIIKLANGRRFPCKYNRFEGSELLVIEPEYVEWDSEEELYPFVFDSEGDWTVTTSVTPPEGFVADNDTLNAEVNSDLQAVQFTVTDIGSRWVDTKVKYRIKHQKEKEKIIESEVGIKLSPRLAKKERPQHLR